MSRRLKWSDLSEEDHAVVVALFNSQCSGFPAFKDRATADAYARRGLGRGGGEVDLSATFVTPLLQGLDTDGTEAPWAIWDAGAEVVVVNGVRRVQLSGYGAPSGCGGQRSTILPADVLVELYL